MFTNQIKDKAAAFKIDPRDVLFSQLIAAGADTGDAYTAIYYRGKDKLTPEQATTRAADMIRNNPAISLVIRQFKQQRPNKSTRANDNNEDEQQPDETKIKAYKSREGVLNKIIRSTDNLTGKDELNGLLAIAKLQGFDRSTNEEEEKRVYFLPWVSSCRSCALMRCYIDATGKEKEG